MQTQTSNNSDERMMLEAAALIGYIVDPRLRFFFFF
jgi:hypothetical protein